MSHALNVTVGQEAGIRPERAIPPGDGGVPAPVRSGPISIRSRGAPPPPRLDRNADRWITASGLAVAGGFVALAVGAVALPEGVRLGAWLPLHLALAGAASIAIGSAMPFFSAALAAAPPAPAALRIAVLGLLATGALGVASRALAPGGPLVVPGGVAYLAGMALLAPTTFRPLLRSFGPRRPVVELAYAVAIADVLVGAGLAVLFVAGWPPVVAGWAAAKPAHAWLNLGGFVSLVIAGTLVHLLPTVVGGRIIPRPSGWVAVAGLVAGAPAVASGLLFRVDVLAGAGAALAVAGALGLVVHAVEVVRARGRWTGDHGWHRIAIGTLLAAIAWFAVAVALAGGRVLGAGASSRAWDLSEAGVPFAVGWVLQATVGAASHILPSIGPGGPVRHAAQRRVLGRLATARIVGLNAGTALLALGMAGVGESIAVGGGSLAGFLAVSGALLAGGALLFALVLAIAAALARE